MNRIKFDNVVAQLETKDRNLVNAVHDALVYEKPGYQFTKAHKERGWDGKIRLFSLYNWTFPAGLVKWVRKIVMSKGLNVELVDLRDRSRRLPPIPPENIENVLEGKKLRDYQVKAIQRIFAVSRGIIQSPTGSGKTVIAAGASKLASEHGLKVLFLTHQKELLHQTRQSFIESGIDAGIVGDGERVFRPVTVATVQTLFAGFPKKDHLGRVKKPGNERILQLMKGADFVILDECHRSDSDTWQAVTNACKSAYYKIGLTATPMMKGVESDMKLMCVTGDVIYRITLQDLIDRGLLAQPYIKFVKIAFPQLKQLPNGRNYTYQQAYRYGVVENNYRNEWIVEETVELAAAGETVLVLVSQINHGKKLQQALHARYPSLKTYFIHGSRTNEQRNVALKALETGRLNVMISSTITDEGVDIRNISAVVLAGGMKSTIKLYQRIGRAMRPKEGLNRCLIVDFIDLTNKHLAKHSKERFEAIKAEPGFIIVSDFSTLLRPPGADDIDRLKKPEIRKRIKKTGGAA